MTLEIWTALHDHHIGVKFSKDSRFFLHNLRETHSKTDVSARRERYFWVSLKPATHVINKSSSGDFRATDAHGARRRADLVSEKNAQCVCVQTQICKYITLSRVRGQQAGNGEKIALAGRFILHCLRRFCAAERPKNRQQAAHLFFARCKKTHSPRAELLRVVARALAERSRDEMF